MSETREFSEVVAGTPQQLFAAVKDHHEWVPTLVPEWFTEGRRHEGEGHAGTVVHYDIHEEKHDTHGGTPNLKLFIEEYNVDTTSYVVEFLGDPRYNYLKFHVRFLPGPSPGTSEVKWFLSYSPVSPGTAPEDEMLNLPRALFKDLAAHLENQ